MTQQRDISIEAGKLARQGCVGIEKYEFQVHWMKKFELHVFPYPQNDLTSSDLEMR